MKTSSNNKFYENYKKLYQNYFLRNPLDQYLLSLVNLEAAVCIKICVLKNFATFTGKQLCWSLFFKKLNFIKKRLQQVFSCEYCEFFKNSIFYRTAPVAASDN